MERILGIGNIFEGFRGVFGVVERIALVVVIEGLFVFFPGLHFTAIAFFSKCEI